jgi:hypothetical protein
MCAGSLTLSSSFDVDMIGLRPRVGAHGKQLVFDPVFHLYCFVTVALPEGAEQSVISLSAWSGLGPIGTWGGRTNVISSFYPMRQLPSHAD